MQKMLFALCAMLVILAGSAGAASAAEIWHIDLETTSLIANPVSGTLYASTPSSEGVIGNSVIPIDPATGEMGVVLFVGSEPGTLAISDDGTTLYADLDGESAIRKVDLTTMTAGLQFSLGSDPYYGPYGVEDIEVQPGNADVIAVSRIRPGWSPRHGGVAIFDNGTQRPNTTRAHTGANRIEFSDTADTLYGCNNETTEFGFRNLRVDLNGVSEFRVWENYIDYFRRDIEFHNGRIYATNGRVSYPGGPNVVGTCAEVGWSNGVIANSDENRIYFTTSDGHGHYIKIFDLTTFDLLEIINIPEVNGGVTAVLDDLVQWGPGALAFRTNGGQVFFVFTGSYGDMQIYNCKVKAGKNGKGDSIKFSGFLDATTADFIEADNVIVTIETDDTPDLNATTYIFPITNLKKDKYKSPKIKPAYKTDPKTSVQIDTIEGKFKFSAKNVDLTGLSCPITITIQIGDYIAESVLGEDIVNGTKKPCPPELIIGI